MTTLHSSITAETSAAQVRTAGQQLRAAREAKGVALSTLSMAIKVPVRQLEALEADEHGAFANAAVMRALAQSVCKHLGLDPSAVLASLPQMVSPLKVVPPVMITRTVQRSPSGWAALDMGVLVPRWMGWVALLLVALGFVLLWPHAEQTAHDAESVEDKAASPVVLGRSDDPVQAPVSVASSSADASGGSVGAVTSSSAAKVSEMPAASSDGQALTLRVREDVWAEMRDRAGRMLIKRLVKAGEVVQLDVAAPVFVYLSRADASELTWQGQMVNFSAHTQNNEVRMQIKP